MSFSLMSRTYPYAIELGAYQYRHHVNTNPHPSISISAASIETETKVRWYIIRPAIYHDSFYTATIPASLQVPTQVTGAIAESVTLRLFQQLFAARNIVKISERPSSKTADFAMDIKRNGQQQHCLVESKGSNMPGGISTIQLNQARRQLEVTEIFHRPRPQAKFATLVSFRDNRIAVIEVI